MGYQDIPIITAALSAVNVPAINLASSGNGGVTGTLPFVNSQAAQVVVGAPATSAFSATSGAYIQFTDGPKVSFTPLITGSYLVGGKAPFFATAGTSFVKIASSAAGFTNPTVLFELESIADLATGSRQDLTPISLYTLNAGSPYCFKFYGKNSTGPINSGGASPSSGIVLFAMQIS